MNKHILYSSLFIVFSIVSCIASGQFAETSDNKVTLETSSSSLPTTEQCNSDPSFAEALVKHGFSVGEAELIKKVEIPHVPDNIKSVKRLFQGQEEVFNSFSTLNRYHIKKTNSEISASFYCFQFLQNDAARAWFDVVGNTPFKIKRLVTFSKPKKLMALSKNHVYLVEGYHIANFNVLHFIIEQLPEVDAVLGPK